MSITTMTSREFNRDASKAKRIATKGPVFITDRGKPAHVLLTVAEYERITNTNKNGMIVDLLAMPNAEDIDFEAPRIDKPLYQPADLS